MGENRCNRCDRKLKDLRAAYGWRCAQILGIKKSSAEMKDQFWDFVNQKLNKGYQFDADDLFKLESILFDDRFSSFFKELYQADSSFGNGDKHPENEKEEFQSVLESIFSFLFGSASAEDNEYGMLSEIMLPLSQKDIDRNKDQSMLPIKLGKDSIIKTWLEKLTPEGFRDIINTFSEHQTQLKARDTSFRVQTDNAEEFLRLCGLADQKGLIPPEMRDHYLEVKRRYDLGKYTKWDTDLRAGVRLFSQLIPPTHDPEKPVEKDQQGVNTGPMTMSYLHDFFRYVSIDYDDNNQIVDQTQINDNTWHYYSGENQGFGQADCVYALVEAEKLWYTKDASLFYLESDLAEKTPRKASGWFMRYIGVTQKSKIDEGINDSIKSGKLLSIQTLDDLENIGDCAILFSGDMNASDGHIACVFRELNEKTLEYEYVVYDSSGYRTEREGVNINEANKTKYFRRKVFTEKLLDQYPYAVKPYNFIDDYKTMYPFIF